MSPNFIPEKDDKFKKSETGGPILIGPERKRISPNFIPEKSNKPKQSERGGSKTIDPAR